MNRFAVFAVATFALTSELQFSLVLVFFVCFGLFCWLNFTSAVVHQAQTIHARIGASIRVLTFRFDVYIWLVSVFVFFLPAVIVQECGKSTNAAPNIVHAYAKAFLIARLNEKINLIQKIQATNPRPQINFFDPIILPCGVKIQCFPLNRRHSSRIHYSLPTTFGRNHFLILQCSLTTFNSLFQSIVCFNRNSQY